MSNVLFDFMLPLKPISNALIKKDVKQKRKVKKTAICPYEEFQRLFSLLTHAGKVIPEESESDEGADVVAEEAKTE